MDNIFNYRGIAQDIHFVGRETEIKKLSLKDRNDWIILDEQFFTFTKLSKIFSIKDLMVL